MNTQVADWRTRPPHPNYFRLLGVDGDLLAEVDYLAASIEVLREVVRGTSIIIQYPQVLINEENGHEQP